ncbi:MAG: enoyl-CoA hydratase/isomerase family protein [Chloroflexi bacterium]|nr:enoyl-CoA hydratase/isomerase family protein [Chloroflexota bacterium]
MAESVVTFTKETAVGYITLNRPPANSYEINFMRELDAAIEAANRDEAVKVVILKSASAKFFSAGADIKAFMANDTAANMEMIQFAHAALEKIAHSNKIYIAAINGHTLGGGLEMALACDLRFVAEGRYRMGLPEVTLGLLPGNGGTQRLPRLIGANKALEMMITGEAVGPEEALRLGLVNKVFAADQLLAETESYAQNLATGATLAIGAIKRCVHDGIQMELHNALSYERQLIAPLFDSEDATEGFTAFAEKRPPEYRGK